MPSDRGPAFAVWLTGLPASGKSTVGRALAAELARIGILPTVLESDAVRREITPNARYGEGERDAFYATLAYLARVLVLHGVPVIVDATANRRVYRDRARAAIPRFLEVHVRCPLAVCQARDPKGIYRRGAEGTAQNVPGVSAPYEPPLTPEVVVDGERDDPVDAARRIVSALEKKGFVPRGPGDATKTGKPL
ncbi:MAG: cysC [Deltaproteobacteria bacterium]|nr:cysC [Deltaproteobacteria bacterium]MBP2687944.1 cysC [Deltaproteobacteria bacterium]MBS1244629.1 cysC [Deltaproteobacteria bacterium]